MFEDISIGVKTFLRDPQLFSTIDAVRRNLPSAQLIIADCGEPTEEKDLIYAELERQRHRTIQLDFDAGFGAMSNAIIDNLNRPYLLVGSDDFDFSTEEARQGIARLKEVLDLCPEVDIASGRVNGNPYEFDLIEEDGVVTEIPLDYIDLYNKKFLWYVRCDLTVNYFLARKRVFEKVRWHDDVRIGGGEHGTFFLECKRAEFQTVYVLGANINEQKIPSSSRYRQFRARANRPERPCFDRIGVKKYILGDGRVDYDRLCD